MIYNEPYTYLNYRDLFSKVTEHFKSGQRVSFNLSGLSWTVRLMPQGGRRKKEKWMLMNNHGTLRCYRRLNQVFNYLRTMMGIEPEEGHIDAQIRKLIHEAQDAQKKTSHT